MAIPSYADNMFQIDIEKEKYALKVRSISIRTIHVDRADIHNPSP